ncbi:MAG TPA: hypothetical protein VFN48_04210 [Solirubrobacteraceae bacterium]|nr:hypothetical protein [Solirubrobacteraceae bacterium]
MTVVPSPSQQVSYEQNLRRRYGVIAFAAGIFVVISLLIQEVGYHNSLTEETVQLITIHKRFPLDILGAVLDAAGLLLTGYALWWLNSISLARDPRISPITRYLVLLGAPLMAVLEVITIVIYSIKANSFVHGTNLGYPAAYTLIHPVAVVLGICSLAEELGALLLAAGFIWTALNAMRVGLLPRPLGYAGVLAGALIIFAIGPISFVVQGAWLVAAGVLISGRWPNDPPAWREGIAIPWLPGGKPNYEAAEAVGASAEAEGEVRAPSAQRPADYTPRKRKKKKR